jgi:hypothetical protein
LQQPHEEEVPAAANIIISSITRTSSLTSPVSNLLRSCFTQWCSSANSSSSSSTGSAAHTGQQQQPAAAAVSGGALQDCSRAAGSSCRQQQRQQQKEEEEACKHSDVAQHALVFCYANDLRWYHTT